MVVVVGFTVPRWDDTGPHRLERLLGQRAQEVV